MGSSFGKYLLLIMWFLSSALLLIMCFLSSAAAVSVVVSNGYEFHAALTSPQVTWVLVADNITFSIETCPFPASENFPATIVNRDVTVMSLSPAALAAAAADGAPLDPSTTNIPQVTAAAANGPFWINCNHLNGRFQLHNNNSFTFNSVILVDCRTLSTGGLITPCKGSTIILNNTVANQGTVCLSLPTAQGIANSLPRQPGLAAPAGRPSAQQYTAYAPTGSNWCAAANGGSINTNPTLPANLMPTVLANDTTSALCQQPALLLANTAWLETPTPINATKGVAQPEQEQFTMLATRSALLCPSPVSPDCLRQNGTDACLAAAYRQVNPDANPPCPAMDGFMVHSCLVDQSVTNILIVQDSEMNITTCPSALSEDPFVINRSVTIMSDPRGPRMKFDCNFMADRVQIPAGITITLQHLLLTRCSIGHEKPMMIFRFDQGSRLFINDTYLLQPDNLCLPVQMQSGNALHHQRPANIPGLQRIEPGQPQEWCPRSSGTRTASNTIAPGTNADGEKTGQPNVDPTSSLKDNNAYSVLPPLPQEFANRTGLGPGWAATLDQPAANRYYTHPTWPNYVLCQQQALLLLDFAYEDRFGWTLPVTITRPESLAMMDQQVAAGQAANATTAAEDPRKLPGDLIRQLGPGYNGTLPVHYINSTWLCQQPSAECARQPNSTAQKACLLQGYTKVNPDVLAAAAAGDPGKNYGVQVVLPAVLGSVGGALLLASLACCLFGIRRRHKISKAQASLAVAKGPYDPAHLTPTSGRYGLTGWLLGRTPSSGASSDPARRLLGIRDFTPAGTTDGTTPSASTANRSPNSTGSVLSSGQRLASVSPDGIQLSMLLGAGSFGRVYSGVWNDLRVAVKIISHSAEDDTRISSELSLSLSFDHPNLVRALHYARLRINPNSAEASLGAPSTAGTGSLFLPEGAVGVFDLPSTWAVIQKQGLAGPPPMIDTETWIVMDLMDRGNLAAAIRQGAFLDTSGEGLRPAALLRRCADIAAGVTYLHSRNVCHGDLKCENILLRTEPQDPDGLMAAVADFGLSRALAFGQSHLSTRRYGTVTHMPPELLVAGKLTPAADVYSFGIMMWEMVTRTPPFAGLHHGEVIHKVVTQDLRPGPWPAAAREYLPPDYIGLAEACWARQSMSRPTAEEVLQRLLDMLAVVEGEPPGQYV